MKQGLADYSLLQPYSATESSLLAKRSHLLNSVSALQALAGQNPLTIRAVTEEDLKKALVTDDDLEHLLEGKTLQEAVASSRLWIMDYYDAYKGFVKRIEDLNKSSVLYCGRCYLYTKYVSSLCRSTNLVLKHGCCRIDIVKKSDG